MLRWMDGFEHYGALAHALEGVGGAAAWSQIDEAWTLSTANPATGTHHLRLTSNVGFGFSDLIRRPVGQSKQVTGMGYRFAVTDLPVAEEDSMNSGVYLSLLQWHDVANAQQIRVNLGTEGSVRALIGNTEIDRSDPCVAAGGYHHFEGKAKIDNTTGYCEIRINEVTVLNLTGIDTQATANAECSQFRVMSSQQLADHVELTMDLDDAFVWDDDASDPENTIIDFVGDKGCYYLPVDADTTEADWLLSAGVTGYELLDETTVNTGDYIYDNTGVARSLFGVAALPANVAEVLAMQPVLYARKEESGTVTLRGGVHVNGQESYTPDNSPSTEYAYMTPGPKTIDPDTGAAWATNADPQLLIERTA